MNYYTGKKEESNKNKEHNDEIPNPDIDFICRGYENLSEEKKRSLKDFLLFLQKDNEGKKR